jgi:CDP-diacylglycerol--serine O-phosphatidyltransferase
MKKLGMLPSMITLGNLLCGFGALAVIAHAPGDNWDREFVIAAWFILWAMVFDMVDGKVARFTNQSTDFGGQLDSLSDLVSFGVAPGLIVYVLAYRVFQFPVTLALLLSGSYVVAAAIRLARFNISSSHEETAHHFFQGLPSPAAAGTIASLVILDHELVSHHRFMGLAKLPTSLAMEILPYVALAAAALMISTIPYVHVTNLILKRRKSPELVIFGLILALFLAWRLEMTLFCVFAGYVLSGPMASARRILAGSHEALEEELEEEEDEEDKQALV